MSKKHRSVNVSALMPYIVLIAVIIIISIFQPGVINFKWLNRQMDTWVSLSLVSIGQTLVFMIGGTDLSLGGVICFTNCLAAVYMPQSGIGILGMSVLIVLIGLAAGILNGIVIVKINLQPFIATLATWAIWYGAAMCVLPTDGGNVPSAFTDIFIHSFSALGGMRVSMIILVALIIIGIFFKASRLGISIRAVGSNEKGAYYGGINVHKTKIMVYAFSGLMAGFAGLFRTAQVASGSPTAGNDFILLSCAAAVIGGYSVSKGYFSFAGAIAGAAVMRLLTSLMVSAGVSSYLTSVFQGLILIASVCVSSLGTILRERKMMEVEAK